MTTPVRITQNDVSSGFGGTGLVRVTEANEQAALDIASPVRFSQLSYQVAVGFVSPRVTQVNAQAAVRAVQAIHVSAHIEVL